MWKSMYVGIRRFEKRAELPELDGERSNELYCVSWLRMRRICGVVQDQFLMQSVLASILVRIVYLADMSENRVTPYRPGECASPALTLNVGVGLGISPKMA
jgi:hypothetical protein